MLGKHLDNTQCKSLLQKSGLQCVLSYCGRISHSYKQGRMWKYSHPTTNLWWINTLQTVKNLKLVGLLYLSFPKPQLKQRCLLMSSWQLICSRFACCLKSSTSPARKTTFALGQQNSANEAFLFLPNPRWGVWLTLRGARILGHTAGNQFCSVAV